MKNRVITWGLFGIISVLFISFFIAKEMVFPAGQPVIDLLNSIITSAREENWTDAEVTANNLMAEWNKKQYLLSLNYAEEDFSLFVDNLARIQGAIITKDVNETVGQSSAALKLWKNFIKVIPAP